MPVTNFFLFLNTRVTIFRESAHMSKIQPQQLPGTPLGWTVAFWRLEWTVGEKSSLEPSFQSTPEHAQAHPFIQKHTSSTPWVCSGRAGVCEHALIGVHFILYTFISEIKFHWISIELILHWKPLAYWPILRLWKWWKNSWKFRKSQKR